MTRSALQWLDQTPTLREASKQVLNRVRPDIERGDARGWNEAGRLRLAEHVAAAGAPGSAWPILGAIDPEQLAPAERERYAFQRRRTAGLVAGAHDVPVPDWEGDGPLDVLRLAAIRADAAMRDGRLDAVHDTWSEALASAATSMEADALRFEGAFVVGRLRVAASRPDAALPLEVATAVARRYGAVWDEASVLSWLLRALRMAGRDEDVVRLGERIEHLPTWGPGPTIGVRSRLLASRDASRGDTAGAIRRLDEGMRRAHGARDTLSVASLAVTKAQIAEDLGHDYVAYRTIKIASSLLRRLQAPPFELELMGKIERDLRARIGEEAWARYGERLVQEVG